MRIQLTSKLLEETQSYKTFYINETHVHSAFLVGLELRPIYGRKFIRFGASAPVSPSICGPHASHIAANPAHCFDDQGTYSFTKN